MMSAPDPPPIPKPIAPPKQPAPPVDLGKNSAAKAGVMSTILTSTQGDLTPSKTSKKSLLGGTG